MFRPQDYRVEIFYSAEDECFIANVPDIQYCSAHGDTQQEALEQVQVALKGCLDELTARGLPLPQPSHLSCAH